MLELEDSELSLDSEDALETLLIELCEELDVMSRVDCEDGELDDRLDTLDDIICVLNELNELMLLMLLSELGLDKLLGLDSLLTELMLDNEEMLLSELWLD